MTNLAPQICLRFKEARKEKGLSQSFLAGEIGCKQSALSMFESGDATKLSEETIRKLSEKLGVSLEMAPVCEGDAVSGEVAFGTPGTVVRGFCPDANCLSNVPYLVGSRVLLRPVRAVAAPNGGRRCAVCGEVLEMRCPTCGAVLNDGACCGVCGQPYVAFLQPANADLAAWVKARRDELAFLKTLV